MTDLGFRYQLRKSGDMVITHHGKPAATLRGDRAASFRNDIIELDDDALQ